MIITHTPGVVAYGDPPPFHRAKKLRKVRPNKAVKRAWPGPHSGSLKQWARSNDPGFEWLARKRGR